MYARYAAVERTALPATLLYRDLLCLYPEMTGLPVRVAITQSLGRQQLTVKWRLAHVEAMQHVPLVQTSIPVGYAQSDVDLPVH